MNYRIVIRVIWLIFALYWLACARGNKRAVRKLNPGFRIPPILGLIGLVLLFIAYPGFFRQQLYARTTAVETIGIVLCMLGVAFAIWARNVLGKNWSGVPQIKEGHELIQAGPYRLVRHPIYTGILLAMFGTGFGIGRVQSLALFLFCFAALWIKLKIEESLMSQQFPETYPPYRNRTKALIPYIL
jgi:protein-S-isoprenylcysteine O-methyltransferase Ste14